MRTQEIAPNEWTGFFDRFSKQHEGWLATLEILAEDVGAQKEALELPFEGISVDSENDTAASLVIKLGKSREHVTHIVNHPQHVWLRQTSEGANDSLEIEGEDNKKTLLSFRTPIRPEFVDGIV